MLAHQLDMEALGDELLAEKNELMKKFKAEGLPLPRPEACTASENDGPTMDARAWFFLTHVARETGRFGALFLAPDDGYRRRVKVFAR